MNIKTTHNIGDKVYVAFKEVINNTYQRGITKEKIGKISIEIKNNKTRESYTLKSGSGVGNDNIFKTKAAAKTAIKTDNIQLLEEEILDTKKYINHDIKTKSKHEKELKRLKKMLKKQQLNN